MTNFQIMKQLFNKIPDDVDTNDHLTREQSYALSRLAWELEYFAWDNQPTTMKPMTTQIIGWLYEWSSDGETQEA